MYLKIRVNSKTPDAEPEGRLCYPIATLVRDFEGFPGNFRERDNSISLII